MSKRNSTLFTPVVDCTPSDFLFTSEEKALKEAQRMFKTKEFSYLRKLSEYKNFKVAVANDLIYTVKYSVKE
jgi:hypothetical protein